MKGSFSFSFQSSCHVLRETFSILTMLPVLFSPSPPTKPTGAGTLSTYFHSWVPRTRVGNWTVAISEPPAVLGNKLYGGTSVRLLNGYGCCYATMAELSSFNRDHTAHKTENMYNLAFYRKSGLTSALGTQYLNGNCLEKRKEGRGGKRRQRRKKG